MTRLKRCALLFLLLIAFTIPKAVLAEVATGVGTAQPIVGTASDGMVLCTEQAGNVPCHKEYDPNMFGIVTFHPAISLQMATSAANMQPVVSSGKAYVLVQGP